MVPPRVPRDRGTHRLVLWLQVSSVAAALGLGYFLWQPYRLDLRSASTSGLPEHISPQPVVLFSSGTQVAVVTAHPDDAEYYLGGTVSRLAASGAKVWLYVMTSGDKSFNPFVDHTRETDIRHREQLRAAARWHAAGVTFMDYPDGRLEAAPDAVKRLAACFRKRRPAYIFTFDAAYPPFFYHRDHRRAGEIAELAAASASVGNWFAFFASRAPNYRVDITHTLAIKLAALKCHVSEFSGSKLTRIVVNQTNDAARVGRILHVRYAEEFRCVKRATKPMSSK